MIDNIKFLEKVKQNKEETVLNIINLINLTDDHKYRTQLIFTLIDNFKDDRIIPTLINLIQRIDLKHYNGSILFACNEYSSEECKDHLSLFVDIVIDGDYEASMGASTLILNFSEPYEWSEELLDELLEKLQTAFKDKSNKNKEFIESLIKLFRNE